MNGAERFGLLDDVVVTLIQEQQQQTQEQEQQQQERIAPVPVPVPVPVQPQPTQPPKERMAACSKYHRRGTRVQNCFSSVDFHTITWAEVTNQRELIESMSSGDGGGVSVSGGGESIMLT